MIVITVQYVSTFPHELFPLTAFIYTCICEGAEPQEGRHKVVVCDNVLMGSHCVALHISTTHSG